MINNHAFQVNYVIVLLNVNRRYMKHEITADFGNTLIVIHHTHQFAAIIGRNTA